MPSPFTQPRPRRPVLALIARAALAAGLMAVANAHADVIYRETFGIAPGSTTTDLYATNFDWQRFDNNGIAVATTGSSAGVNYSAIGRPVDVANVNAGPNNDATFAAYTNGILYFAATPSPSLGFTPEYPVNPANYVPGTIVFSWYEGNNTAPHVFRVLVRVGGLWYASTNTFLTPVVTLANFGAQAQLKSFTYDPAPQNWQQVNFNGDLILSGTPGSNTSVNSTLGAVSLGAAPAAPLSGVITAFGFYGENGGSGTGNRRVDSVQIDATPIVTGTAKHLLWSGAVGADWDTAALNWLAAGSPTNYAQGDFVTFDDSGFNNPNVNLVTVFAPGGVTVSNPSVAYVFGGVGGLSGTNRLVKQGAGALTITTANNYSGGTIISGGTVNVGDGGGTGTLGTGPVTNHAALVFNRNNDLTFTGIFGSGSVTHNGGAALTLFGANSFSGPLIVNSGTLILAGNQTGGGLLTNAPSTTLAGSGTNTGPVVVAGLLAPGASAGTFTAGALTFAPGGTAAFELNSSPTVGSGVNDLLQVNGNLTLNDNSLSLVLLGPPQLGVPYRLINFSGTRSGSFNPTVTIIGGSRFSAALSYDDGLGQVNVTFAGSPANLRWDSAGDTAWSPGTATNWFNLGASAPDAFFDFDSVRFDDTPGLQPAVDLADGVTVRPAQIVVDSTNTAYTIGGQGRIAGSATLTKQGPSTLVLGGTNAFSGGIVVHEGMVRLSGLTAPGTGSLTVNSNGVLVAGGAHTNAITLAGGVLGGVSGIASLGGELTAVTGTTSTIAMTDPQDYAPNSEMNFTGTLQGGGHLNVIASTANFNVDGGVGFRLRGTGASTFTGVITISNNVKAELQTSVTTPFSPAGTGKIRLVAGDASLGGTVTAASAANGLSELNLRNNSTNHAWLGNDVEILGAGLVTLNPLGTAPTNAVTTLGNLKMGGGQELGIIRNSGQPQIVAFQSVTLTGGDATFSPKTPDFGAAGATGSDLSLSNITQQIPGCGIVMNGLRTLYLAGTNGFTGNTTVSNGVLSLLGASSLSNSPVITLSAPGTLSVTGRAGGTLVLVSGQKLQGNGTLNGNLVANAGATVSPGDSLGGLTLSGTTLLQGTTVMEIDKQAGLFDSLQGAVNLTYGGTLVISNLTDPLVAGDSFPLFSAGSYSSAFAAIVPATPGPGLAWDTSTLTMDGTLRIVAAPNQTPPLIGGLAVVGGELVISGTNGTAGNDYYVLTSTNLALPRANWTAIATNIFGPGGGFAFTNAVDPNSPRRFYLLQLP